MVKYTSHMDPTVWVCECWILSLGFCHGKPTGQAAKVGALVGTILFPASKTQRSGELNVDSYHQFFGNAWWSCNSGKNKHHYFYIILLRDLNWASLSIVAVFGQDPSVSTCINMHHQLGVTGGWKAMAFLWWCSHRRVFEYSGNIGPVRVMGVSLEFTEWSLILINQDILYSLIITKLWYFVLYCTCMLKVPANIEAVLCGLGAACSHWFLDESQVDYVGGPIQTWNAEWKRIWCGSCW